MFLSLIEPSFGLVFWMSISFLIVLFILKKFAWKPILQALEDRETSIDDALNEAKKAREEIANMTASNETLMREAREEREILLKEARDIRDKEIASAKERATSEADAIIARAREDIRNERSAAIVDIKNQVGELSVQIAEKVLREKLGDKSAQHDLVNKLVEEADLKAS